MKYIYFFVEVKWACRDFFTNPLDRPILYYSERAKFPRKKFQEWERIDAGNPFFV